VGIPRHPGEKLMTETLTGVRISLETGCDEACVVLAWPLYRQFAKGYEVCSVLEAPGSLEQWRETHRTARKRAARAERLGYRFADVRREEYVDDIYAVNTSSPERQGRRMSSGYWERPSDTALPEYACPRHTIRQNAVISDQGHLVAYLWMFRLGDLALVSQFLGHAEHMPNDVMYLLFQGALKREIEEGGFVVYNRHDSGTDGLRYYKERCGFQAMEVTWAL
jgi:hypothetical protein